MWTFTSSPRLSWRPGWPPTPAGCGGHVDVPHPEVRHGVLTATALWTAGVAPMVPASPIPLTPSGSRCRGRHVEEGEGGQLGGRREAVVGEARGQRVAVGVEHDLLEQRLAMPWAIPPWRWPSASSGLSTGPASSTVTIRTRPPCRTRRRPRRRPGGRRTGTRGRWSRTSPPSAAVRTRRAGRAGPRLPCRAPAPRRRPPRGRRPRPPARPPRAAGRSRPARPRPVHRDAAGLQAARAHRARAARDEVGVAVLDGDHLDRDSSCSPASIAQAVAWPCPRGAGEHGDRAVRVHLDRGAFGGRAIG